MRIVFQPIVTAFPLPHRPYNIFHAIEIAKDAPPSGLFYSSMSSDENLLTGMEAYEIVKSIVARRFVQRKRYESEFISIRR
jgi:hypothetical protein